MGADLYLSLWDPISIWIGVENAFQIRTPLTRTRDICKKYGCPLELILKDISTVHYAPQHLAEWRRIAMEVVGV